MKREDFESTWIEINLTALKKNLEVVRGLVKKDTRIMGIVKCNAYGHGAVGIAKGLVENGIDALGTASVKEGVELRESDIYGEIIILNECLPETIGEILEYDLTPTVFSFDFAEEMDYYSKKNKRITQIHIRIDTSSSIGIPPEELKGFLQFIKEKKNLFVSGIFTHFVSSYSGDMHEVNDEINLFNQCISICKDEGMDIPLIHGLSSPGLFKRVENNFSMARAGTCLYGISSFKGQNTEGMEPVMQLKTQIIDVCNKGRGICRGYTEKTYLDEGVKTAWIPLGYGVMPLLMFMKGGEVLLRGVRVPILATSYMGRTLIDITDVPDAKEGDEVVIFGKQGRESITVEDIAAKCGIDIERSESICLMDKSIERRYKNNDVLENLKKSLFNMYETESV